MLSKILEHAVNHNHPAESFLLEQVSQIHESAPASDSPETAALLHQIAQLERALVEKEAAAYARGRREAEAEAQQRYSAAMQSTADNLAHSVKQLADLRPRLCKEAEADLLRLSIAVAQRILHRELNIDPMALQALVKVCLDRLGRQDQVHVRVTPALAESVRSVLTKLSSRAIDVTADSNLEAGALIFETARGQLDASLRSQLDEIERGLIDRLEKRA